MKSRTKWKQQDQLIVPLRKEMQRDYKMTRRSARTFRRNWVDAPQKKTVSSHTDGVAVRLQCELNRTHVKKLKKVAPDVILNLVILALGIGSALLAWKLAPTSAATESDIGIIAGLIVAAISFVFVVYLEALRARKRIVEAETRLLRKIGLDEEFYPRDETIAEGVRALCQRQDGVEGVRRRILGQLLIGNQNFEEYSVPISTEKARIRILTEVVRAAQNYVYACTYAEYTYLKDFWDEPLDEIDAYYQAQREAILNGRKVWRLFIIPTGAELNPKFEALMSKIIEAHRTKAGMVLNEHVFRISDENATRELLSRGRSAKKESFFVCDDRFWSSGEARLDAQHAPRIVSFFRHQHITAGDFEQKFRILKNAEEQRVGTVSQRDDHSDKHANRPSNGND